MARGLRQALHRIHHVDGDRELRLEPFAHRASARFEPVDRVRDRARVDEEAPAFVRELRIALGPIEQLHAELRFQVRERLAHHGLRAPQLASGGRKAALVHGRDERPQLIEGYAVEHGHRPKRYLVSKYIGFSDGWRDPSLSPIDSTRSKETHMSQVATIDASLGTRRSVRRSCDEPAAPASVAPHRAIAPRAGNAARSRAS